MTTSTMTLTMRTATSTTEAVTKCVQHDYRIMNQEGQHQCSWQLNGQRVQDATRMKAMRITTTSNENETPTLTTSTMKMTTHTTIVLTTTEAKQRMKTKNKKKWGLLQCVKDNFLSDKQWGGTCQRSLAHLKSWNSRYYQQGYTMNDIALRTQRRGPCAQTSMQQTKMVS